LAVAASRTTLSPDAIFFIDLSFCLQPLKLTFSTAVLSVGDARPYAIQQKPFSTTHES